METENGKSGEIIHLKEMKKSEIIRKYLGLQSALSEAEKELVAYKRLLAQKGILSVNGVNIHEMEYNPNWSWLNKIVFVLKKLDRPLLSSEFIEFMMPYEPVLQYSRHKAQALSAHLTKAVKYGRIRTYKLHGARGYYYVLAPWLSPDGELGKEYKAKILFQ